MDTLRALAKGDANRGKLEMVFDWEKAARLIVKRKPEVASAGLRGDWEWTGGEIYKDNAPVPRDETYTYLASTWATPELDLDGEIVECFRMDDKVPDWGSETYWPDAAINLLAKPE